MTEESRFHVLDYLSVVRRRKWWLVVPFGVSVGVGVALALLLPKEYLSNVTLAISAPSLSTDIVRPASRLDREERTRAISQQLLSRAVLERVVREEGLAVTVPIGDAMQAVRARVQVTFPPALGPKDARAPIDSFIVSYTDRTPAQAQKVADRLANVFVEHTSRLQEARAEGTAEFLAMQLHASQTQLRELEARLRRAKEEHMGRLPEQTSANLQMVANLQQQLESNAVALRSEQDRLSMIESQIEEMEQGTGMLMGADGRPTTTEERVADLERQLAAKRTIYTDKHPEVQRLVEELAAARARAADSQGQPNDNRAALLKTSPAYRQRVTDRDRTRLRIAELRRAEEKVRQQVAMYQARIELAPMVEQQLLSLQRDYELEKRRFSELSSKYQTALLAEDLERKDAGERFRVLHAATFPTQPFKPNRAQILGFSFLIGLFLGGGLVFGREYLDRSVHDARALTESFGVPVLAEIPRIDRAAA